MLYTKKQYYLDEGMKNKLDTIAVRSAGKRKLDTILVCDGDEGFGKTGMSLLWMYYLHEKTGRPFSIKNIFFDPDRFVKFINTTREQLIIWDESALGGLSTAWASKVQQMIIQTLMTCRFRKHIIIMNIPKFYRMNSYFVQERIVGLIHVYSRDNLNAGWFTYYKKDVLENMIDCWNKRRKKPYKLFPCIRGTFPDAFRFNIINEEEYDRLKEERTNEVISKFRANTGTRGDAKLIKLQYWCYALKGFTLDQKAEMFKVSRAVIGKWGKHIINYPELFKED